MHGKILEFSRRDPVAPKDYDELVAQRQDVEEFIRSVREENLRERRQKAMRELLVIAAILACLLSFAAGAWWAVK